MKRLAPRSGNVFSGVPLDRVAHLRRDERWLSERLRDPASRFVAVWNQRHVIIDEHAPRAEVHDRDSLGDLLEQAAAVALLGVQADEQAETAYFALDLSHLAEETLLALSSGGRILDLRESVQIVPSDEAAMLAYARGLIYWNARHLFCGVCGSPTESRSAGHERVCTSPECGASHFPRTDSAVIMLVHDGDRCLLSRESRWPRGMHSILAGFLEPGESFEEAVAREVLEETSIRVADVRYHSSQPWPFPSSIMIGFTARALTREIVVDTDELDYAHWYRRDDLKAIEDSDEFRLPGHYSISRRIINDWIAGRIPD